MFRRLCLFVVAACVFATAALADPAAREDYFTKSDGVRIHYLTAGASAIPWSR